MEYLPSSRFIRDAPAQYARGFMETETEITDAVRHPESPYTFSNHGVTHETARSDLTDLLDRGLLTRRRRGRTHVFEPLPNLAERLKDLGP